MNEDGGVPLSRLPGSGTAGQQSGSRDHPVAAAAPFSLKALARKAYAGRSGLRVPGSKVGDVDPPTGTVVGQPRSTDATPRNADFEERAAIVEFDGGAPRLWAEGFARLDLSHPIPGFTGADWRQLIDDGGRFLDRWASEAASLGWTAEDVFGLNPAAPATRYDGMGLVALIRGGQVIGLKSDRATIRMTGGSCLTYYLRRPRPGAVAAWELL